MSNNRQNHLGLIQGIINRLSQNSFLLKGWSVVLVSAMFALAANKTEILFMYLAYFPAVAFWFLDGYFLRQERLFRKLYDKVRNTPEEQVDFSMDTSIVDSQVKPFFKVVFSMTLFVFHGVVIASILLVSWIFIV